MKQKLLFISIIIFMFILILFPEICMEGTEEGIILWYQSIVPTLLPYMMLTNILINTGVLNGISSENSFFSLNTLLSVSIGFLCGYPMGAHFVSQNYKSGNISKPQAYWLLSFVNLCSPAFIIQFIVIKNLNSEYLIPMIISLYGGAILTAIFTLPIYYSKHKNKKTNQSVIRNNETKPDTQPITDAMLQCLKLLGYIILFSIILKMVTALTNTVTIGHIIMIGILEITHGIVFTTENIKSLDISALLISAFTAFGSISCIFQTNSVCKDSQLKMFPYIIAKITQAVLSLLIMYMILLFK